MNGSSQAFDQLPVLVIVYPMSPCAIPPIHLHLSAQMCVQRVLDKIYEAFEVVVLLEKHRGIKLFRLTVLAKRC